MDCIRCKGRVDSRFACGREFCPIYARSEAMFKSVSLLSKEEFQGTSPNVFVGRYGYPKVNVGILSPPEQNPDAWVYDAPSHWAANSFPIRKVIELRSSLINSRFSSDIKQPSKILLLAQEIAMSSKPIDVDVKLFEKPEPKLNFSSITMPMGPSALLKKVDLTSNPRISVKVEKVVSDTDLKAVDAVRILYDSGFKEGDISKVLSIGVLGVKNSRKLVPTRWSISATDDMLAKMLIRKIKDHGPADYQLFHGDLYGNYYFIMLFPDVWSYELFEGYLPKSLWNSSCDVDFSTDYEPYAGRKSYADNTAGGYYAARLPIAEKLEDMKRQASVLVVRFVTDEYSCPLGVFVCREAVRKSLCSRPVVFNSREEMLSYAKGFVKKMFDFDLSVVLKKSILLNNLKTQTRISDF